MLPDNSPSFSRVPGNVVVCRVHSEHKLKCGQCDALQHGATRRLASRFLAMHQLTNSTTRRDISAVFVTKFVLRMRSNCYF